MKVFRPYQDDTFGSVLTALETLSSTLVVWPTGTGKTVLMARLAAQWPRGNVLILAHRTELLDQAADKLEPELGYRPAIEQADRKIDEDCLYQGGMVLIASVQTLTRLKRLEKFQSHPFDLILIDEAHHATAPSYRRITDYFLTLNPACKIVGVTATPKRADGKAMGAIFAHVAYELPIQTAIEDGWLVPFRPEYVTIEGVDFSTVRTTVNEFGESDFRSQDLEPVLIEEEPLWALARPILEKAEGRRTLVFTAGVAHAHLLAAVLNREKPESAAAVDGTTPKERRKEILAEFASGKTPYLANCAVLTEGFDLPDVACVAMGRPTKSVSAYMQMLGRGLRPLTGIVDGYDDAADRKMAILTSEKPYCLVLDFVGNSKHKLVGCVDVLAGHYDLDVIKQAKADLAAKPGSDVLRALKLARAELLLKREQEARRHIRAQVTYSTTEVDPFGNGPAPAVRQNQAGTRGGSTDGQIGFLVGLGVPYEVASGYTRRQASTVINRLKETRCTTKQQAILRRYGYPTDVPFDRAKELIDKIAQNGWRKPREEVA